MRTSISGLSGKHIFVILENNYSVSDNSSYYCTRTEHIFGPRLQKHEAPIINFVVPKHQMSKILSNNSIRRRGVLLYGLARLYHLDPCSIQCNRSLCASCVALHQFAQLNTLDMVFCRMTIFFRALQL